jgi:hypothetical protein
VVVISIYTLCDMNWREQIGAQGVYRPLGLSFISDMHIVARKRNLHEKEEQEQ